jgi:thioredoxin-related protein
MISSLKTVIILILISTLNLNAEIKNMASSYQNGLANAKKQNKTLMIMFTSKDCKQCNYMQSSIYEDEKITDYINKNYIYMEQDVDIDNYGYKVVITPTIYFINGKGKSIGKIVGARNADLFLKELKKY